MLMIWLVRMYLSYYLVILSIGRRTMFVSHRLEKWPLAKCGPAPELGKPAVRPSYPLRPALPRALA